jgi:hypothetical protein
MKTSGLGELEAVEAGRTAAAPGARVLEGEGPQRATLALRDRARMTAAPHHS